MIICELRISYMRSQVEIFARNVAEIELKNAIAFEMFAVAFRARISTIGHRALAEGRVKHLNNTLKRILITILIDFFDNIFLLACTNSLKLNTVGTIVATVTWMAFRVRKCLEANF